MLLDSHCHLDQLDDAEAALAEALAVGVQQVVAVSEDGASLARVLKLKRRFPEQVLAGVGFHPMLTPHRTRREVESDLAAVEAALGQADLVGEIGLDYKHAATDEEKAWQREVLDRQMALAEGAQLPINLHSRRAQRQTMLAAIEFTERTGLGAQLHWFTQSKKLVRLCNQAGVYVSAGPSILFNEQAREVAGLVDRRLLLLETDSPVPFEGESARPAWVARVAEVVAALWECPLEEVGEVTSANHARYLGKKG